MQKKKKKIWNQEEFPVLSENGCPKLLKKWSGIPKGIYFPFETKINGFRCPIT